MRHDVVEMERAIDRLWVFAAAGYAGFAGWAILFGLILEFDGPVPFLGIVAVVPWLVQAVIVRRRIRAVNRRTASINGQRP